LSHSASPLCVCVCVCVCVLGIFEIVSLELFAQGWLQTMILLISASWVAKITGVSHRHPARIWAFVCSFLFFGGTGVWTQGLALLGKCSATWPMSASFALVIFQVGSGWPVLLPSYLHLPSSCDEKHAVLKVGTSETRCGSHL
jgi:hypothetical protein